MDRFNRLAARLAACLRERQVEFVTIDFETAGLPSLSPILPATPAKVLAALGKAVATFPALQLGFTVVTREPSAETPVKGPVFRAFPFDFYVPLDQPLFSAQPSTLAFLRRNRFDFNAWADAATKFDWTAVAPLGASRPAPAGLASGAAADSASEGPDEGRRLRRRRLRSRSRQFWTSLFQVVKELGVPLVGHNCLIDIVYALRLIDGAPVKTHRSLVTLARKHLPANIYDTKLIFEHFFTHDAAPNEFGALGDVGICEAVGDLRGQNGVDGDVCEKTAGPDRSHSGVHDGDGSTNVACAEKARNLVAEDASKAPFQTLDSLAKLLPEQFKGVLPYATRLDLSHFGGEPPPHYCSPEFTAAWDAGPPGAPPVAAAQETAGPQFHNRWLLLPSHLAGLAGADCAQLRHGTAFARPQAGVDAAMVARLFLAELCYLLAARGDRRWPDREAGGRGRFEELLQHRAACRTPGGCGRKHFFAVDRPIVASGSIACETSSSPKNHLGPNLAAEKIAC